MYKYDRVSNSDGIFCNLTQVLTKYILNTCLKQCWYYRLLGVQKEVFCNLTDILTKYIPNTCLKQCWYYKLLGVLKVKSRSKTEGPILHLPENSEQITLIAQTLAKRVTSGPSCGIKGRNFLH